MDLQLMAAMGPPGGGRNSVTDRFLRHFNIISIATFNDETMTRIFSNIFSFYLKELSFSTEYFACGTQIVAATMEVCMYLCTVRTYMCVCVCVHGGGAGGCECYTSSTYLPFPVRTWQMYKEAMKHLLPTPAKSHYTFNLRDFSRVVNGVMLIRPQSLENKKTFTRYACSYSTYVRTYMHGQKHSCTALHSTVWTHMCIPLQFCFVQSLTIPLVTIAADSLHTACLAPPPPLPLPSPRLWVHEVYRVYYDRLIDDTDRSWVHNKVKELVKTHFKEDYTGLFRHLLKPGSTNPTEDDMRSLMFGDYMQPDSVSGS